MENKELNIKINCGAELFVENRNLGIQTSCYTNESEGYKFESLKELIDNQIGYYIHPDPDVDFISKEDIRELTSMIKELKKAAKYFKKELSKW